MNHFFINIFNSSIHITDDPITYITSNLVLFEITPQQLATINPSIEGEIIYLTLQNGWIHVIQHGYMWKCQYVDPNISSILNCLRKTSNKIFTNNSFIAFENLNSGFRYKDSFENILKSNNTNYIINNEKYKIVDTISDRNNIDISQQTLGMAVYVIEDLTTYKLINPSNTLSNSNWIDYWMSLYDISGASSTISGGVTVHNLLSGIQGGTTNQYYHLSLSQYNDYIGSSLVASLTGNLQTQINSINISGDGFIPYAGTGMTITPTSGNYIFSVSDYISKTEVSTISGNIQNQINIITNGSLDSRYVNISGDTMTGNLTVPYLVVNEINPGPLPTINYQLNGNSILSTRGILDGIEFLDSTNVVFFTVDISGATISALSGNQDKIVILDSNGKLVPSNHSISSLFDTITQQTTASYFYNFIANENISGSTYPVLVGGVSGEENKVSLLDVSDSTLYVSPIGFVTENYSFNQYIPSIITHGEIVFPPTTFIPGKEVYADPSVYGGITHTKPTTVGEYIVPVGIAKNDSTLLVRIESPYFIEAFTDPIQDISIFFKSPSEFDVIEINIGDIVTINDTVENHPILGTNSNYLTYTCILQYIGDGDALTSSELLSYFQPLNSSVSSISAEQNIFILDVTSSGLGETDRIVSPGQLVVIDDSVVYSQVIPGSGNLNHYPVYVCTNGVTGSGSSFTRSMIENNFRPLSDTKFKLVTTTNDNTSNVNIDFSSTSYEAYHITVKVMADGSTGYKFFATYQFGMTGEPAGMGGCTIQGSITSDILFNPLAELQVSFSDPGDTLQITFNSTGRTSETYTWVAWVIVERL